MTSFHKPQSLKAALILGLYGAAGAGQTFSGLLIAQGLARHTGKRIGYCDTAYGNAFYSQHVPERAVHPEAFEFDVMYTKSIMEVLGAVKALDTNVYGVLVIDSTTHLWEAAKNAYAGRLTQASTIASMGTH